MKVFYHSDNDGKCAGYNAPFKISNRCCDIMKKKPSKQYTKENIVLIGGITAPTHNI